MKAARGGPADVLSDRAVYMDTGAAVESLTDDPVRLQSETGGVTSGAAIDDRGPSAPSLAWPIESSIAGQSMTATPGSAVGAVPSGARAGRDRGDPLMIRVVCGCGRVFKAEDRHAGMRTRCPVCGTSLIIGQTPTSGSDERSLDEVPSWWYPTDPPISAGGGAAPAQDAAKPDAVPTTVLEPVFVARREEFAGLQDDARRVQAGPANTGRAFWILAATVGLSAALILGVLCWVRGIDSEAGDAAARRAPRAAAVQRDAGRGPGLDAVHEPNPAGRLPESGHQIRPAPRLGLIVPAYIYPNEEGRLQWRRLMDAAAKVDLVAVVNCDNGPGLDRNSDYASIIAEAAGRGMKLVGYISTRWAERPATEVKGEVDAWIRLYPRIVGFFLDQQPEDARHAAYIADISTYARSKLRDAIVITNPGIPCDESYLARRASDLVCVFANSEGFARFELPANLREYGASRCAALVYQVADAESMHAFLKEAIVKRIGHVFITDGKLPNPWNRLPAYWEAEVEAVTRLQ
jgi:hypothetical protein